MATTLQTIGAQNTETKTAIKKINDTNVNGICKCKSVTYKLPHLPNLIAQCFCSICNALHKESDNLGTLGSNDQKPVEFAEYKLDDVVINGAIEYYPSSEKAVRLYCKECKTFCFMYYRGSGSIWVYVATLPSDILAHIGRHKIFEYSKTPNLN
jgi:hypothetical protein